MGGGKILILVLVAIILIHLLQYIWPEYYTKISIGINKIPIFLLGVYAGQISIRQREKEGIVLLITVIMVWIASFFLKGIWTYGVSLYGMTEKIVYMFSICLFFLLVEHWSPIKWIRIFLSWFGKYSLELYVLHLLIFCFVSSKMVLADIDPIVKVVIMLLGALALCVPFHNLIDIIVRSIKFNNQ